MIDPWALSDADILRALKATKRAMDPWGGPLYRVYRSTWEMNLGGREDGRFHVALRKLERMRRSGAIPLRRSDADPPSSQPA